MRPIADPADHSTSDGQGGDFLSPEDVQYGPPPLPKARSVEAFPEITALYAAVDAIADPSTPSVRPTIYTEPVVTAVPVALPIRRVASVRPTTYEALVDLEDPEKLNHNKAGSGKSVEELTAKSREYVALHRELADFVYSDQFQRDGYNSIPATLVEAVERFHAKSRVSPTEEKKHAYEIAALEQMLTHVFRPHDNRALHTHRIMQLLRWINDPRFTRAKQDASAEVSIIGSKEYVAARNLLADLVKSDLFRLEGRNVISDTLIAAIEYFHARRREGPAEEERHARERTELLEVVRHAPRPEGASAAYDEGILELNDFVGDPFLCHQMWQLCRLSQVS